MFSLLPIKMKVRTKILLITVSLAVAVLLGGMSRSYLSVKPSADAWVAAGQLAKSGMFGFGPRGLMGTISDEERQFFRILRSPKSHLVFRQVYDTGTPEARAYAVVGLNQTFMGRQDGRMGDFSRSTTPFAAIRGCVATDDNLPEALMAELDSESFAEYLRENR